MNAEYVLDNLAKPIEELANKCFNDSLKTLAVTYPSLDTPGMNLAVFMLTVSVSTGLIKCMLDALTTEADRQLLFDAIVISIKQRLNKETVQ